MEEKSREMGEAVARYGGYRWRTCLPWLLVATGLMFLLPGALWVAEAVVRLEGLSPGSAQGRAWMRRIIFGSLILSIVLLIGVFAPWYEKWRRRQFGAVPVEPKLDEKQALRGLGALFFGTLFGGVAWQLWREFVMELISSRIPRLGPLLWVLPFDIMLGTALLYTWLRTRRTTMWNDVAPVAIVVGIGTAYCVAVALGLPQPRGEVLGPCGLPYRVLVPWLAAAVLLLVIGEICSRRVFRRLQRLVNEETVGD